MASSPSPSSVSSLSCELIRKLTSVPPKGILLAEHALASIAVIMAINYLRKHGFKGVLGSIVSGALKVVPGAQAAVQSEIEKEVSKSIDEMFSKPDLVPKSTQLPKNGHTKEEVFKMMNLLKENDAKAEDGKVWAYVYTTNEEHASLLAEAYNLFMHENALNPMTFPSLRRFENEVVSMTKSMLHGDENTVGTMTSGGTESIMMAIKTYRDRARHIWPHITEPEILLPTTAHVAFEKAAHYFGLKTVYVPVDENFRVDVNAMRKAITKNTIVLVCSAPQYPHGIVDPVEQVGSLAQEYGLPLHVDSCIGGFLLPWVEKLGYNVPVFDFRVPGVTSISADVHKYGFAVKGASCIIYRNAELRKYQFFVFTQWPGGLFGSPSFLGTRSGGTIAAAWAALMYLGEKGYMEIAKVIMETATKLRQGINNIAPLKILGDPHMSILAFSSTDPSVNIFAVADVLEKKFDWHMERQQKPDCIHLTIMPPHAQIADKFLSNLKEAVKEVQDNPNKAREGSAAMYGMVAKIPDTSLVESFIEVWLNKVYKL